MPTWECKYQRMSVNSSSLFFFFPGRDKGAKRVPNCFTTAGPRSYFSIRLSLNLSMTSEYQLAKKTKKTQPPTQTQPTHNTPLVFFPLPTFSSYPKSFFTAREPTAFSLPKKHAAYERAMEGQSRSWESEGVSPNDFYPSPRLICIPPK